MHLTYFKGVISVTKIQNTIRQTNTSNGLRSWNFCFVDFTIMIQASKACQANSSRQRVEWFPHQFDSSLLLSLKPPFVPILVIAIVVSLMRKLRLTGDDIIYSITYSAHRQKFDFSPSFNVRHCGNTLMLRRFLSSSRLYFVALLLLNILILWEKKLQVFLTFYGYDVFVKRVRL